MVKKSPTITTTDKAIRMTTISSKTPHETIPETPTTISNGRHYKIDNNSSNDSNYNRQITTGKKTTSNLPRLPIPKLLYQNGQTINKVH